MLNHQNINNKQRLHQEKFNLLQTKEILSAVFFFFIVFSVGSLATYNLQALGFYQHVNIAFDLDQAWFIDSISRPSEAWLYRTASEFTPLWIKHPLLYALRLPAEIIQAIGFTEEFSAIFVSLFFVAAAPVMLFYCLRLCRFSFTSSIVFTLAYSLSASFLANLMVLDSYSIAQFWIFAAIIFLLKSKESALLKPTWLKAMVYVGLAGTTSYLILFAILCELSLLMTKKEQIASKVMLNYLFLLTVKFSSLFLLAFFLIYSDTLIALISDPVSILQQTLWAVARSGEKEGLVKVLETFMIYSLISPEISSVSIESGVTMLDYRSTDFSLLGYLSLLGLCALYLFFLKDISSFMVKFCTFWIVMNISFHLIYQDRGSLFLYTGHLLPVVFLSLCLAINRLKKYANAVGIALIILLFTQNADVYTDVKQSIETKQSQINEEQD